jgi:hypothetical protein
MWVYIRNTQTPGWSELMKTKIAIKIAASIVKHTTIKKGASP